MSTHHPVHRPVRRWRRYLGRLTGSLGVRSRGRTLMTSDRGDVPGWVLVTVMTAGLVTALWLVADDQLTAVLGRAIQSVTSP